MTIRRTRSDAPKRRADPRTPWAGIAGRAHGAVRRAFTAPTLSRGAAVTMTERLAAVTACVSSLEYLAGASALHRGGLNDASIRFAGATSRSAKALAFAASPAGSRGIHGLRIVASIALLVPSGRRVRLAADGTLATTATLLFLTEPYGTDGSDQVALLAHGATAVARVGEADHRTVDAALWFLALQSGLSYLASGFAKGAGESWTSGTALPDIFRTQTYGHEPSWRFLRSHPALARRAARAVVVVECAMPLAALARGRLTWTYVTISELFHLANGLSMGLGRFLWAYSGLHPAVVYVSASQDDLPQAERRSDALLVVVAGMVAAAWSTSALSGTRARRMIRRGTAGDQTLVTQSGNLLTYKQLGEWSSNDPVVFIEAGLGSSDVNVVRVSRTLAQQHPVLTYSRAGYGNSRWRTDLPPSLDVAREDARDLVRRVVGDERRIVMVGHSLGGHLVLSAHPDLAARCVARAVLDPTHVERDEHRGEKGRSVLHSVTWITRSLSAGLGKFMLLSNGLSDLPNELVALATAQYRDAATWTATRRELTAVFTEQELDARDGDAPLLVMTGEYTGSGDPPQLELDRELAARRTEDVHRIIASADHMGLVARQPCVNEVAGLIHKHVATVTA